MRNALGYLVTVVAARRRARHAHHSRPRHRRRLHRLPVGRGPHWASQGVSHRSLEPIAATAFSALIMGSNYTAIDIVGMALIVGAVVTISVVDLLRARRVTQ